MALIIGIGDKTVNGLAKPTKQQLIWHEQELGMFFHFDIPVFKPGWNWRSWRDYPAPDMYNPAKLDTDQWMEAAKAMGAKYVVFVAKHCSGFLQWQSNLYNYGVKQSGWRGGKGDVVKDFVESARRYGLKPGLYASLSANGWLGVDNPGRVNHGHGGDDAAQKRYNDICENMVTELWTRYGELFEIWFDGGVMPPEMGGPTILPLLEKYQPQAIVFQGPKTARNCIRWIGNERGVASYPCWSSVANGTSEGGDVESGDFSGNPDAPLWIPGESDVPIRNHAWFWGENEGNWKYWSDEELLDKYYSSVGRNTNLLLNANPGPDGLVDERDMAQYRRFGNMIKNVYANRVGEVSGDGAELVMKLMQPEKVNQIELMEDIGNGHVVRRFTIDGELAEGGVKTLAEGSCIGHKCLMKFTAEAVKSLRLRITDAVGTPHIRAFRVYAHH